MYTPLFSTKEFLSAAGFNQAAGFTKQGIIEIATASYGTTGIFNFASMTTSQVGLLLTLNFPFPFEILFPGTNLAGTQNVASAHGTTDGNDSQSYVVNLSSFVPGSGSQTVFVFAQPTTIKQTPYTVVGPPIGHPSWDPTFVPYLSYATTVDSYTISAGTSIGAGGVELARTTLASGATTFVLDFTHVVRAQAQVANQTGLFGQASLQIDNNGRITTVSDAVHGCFTFSSSQVVAVPAGVTQMTVEMWGGGGGGGGGGAGAGGSGGGGGAYARFHLTGLVPGANLPAFVVGGGGTGGSGAAGSNGGDTTFNGTLVVAGGGKGGATTGGTNAGGVVTTTGIIDVQFTGQSGQASTSQGGVTMSGAGGASYQSGMIPGTLGQGINGAPIGSGGSGGANSNTGGSGAGGNVRLTW